MKIDGTVYITKKEMMVLLEQAINAKYAGDLQSQGTVISFSMVNDGVIAVDWVTKEIPEYQQPKQ